MAFTNVWHRRTAADSRPCYVCYKPTPTVLNHEEGKDWFFICGGHLSDRGFATPLIDEEEAAKAKKRKELDEQIELVKKEYEEKMAKKGKSKDKDKEVQKLKEQLAKKEETEKDAKVTALEAKKGDDATGEPRVFNLHKSIFQMRQTRLRNAQQAKLEKERLKNTPAFPMAPSGDFSK